MTTAAMVTIDMVTTRKDGENARVTYLLNSDYIHFVAFFVFGSSV